MVEIFQRPKFTNDIKTEMWNRNRQAENKYNNRIGKNKTHSKASSSYKTSEINLNFSITP
jgi:hypothetical protein